MSDEKKSQKNQGVVSSIFVHRLGRKERKRKKIFKLRPFYEEIQTKWFSKSNTNTYQRKELRKHDTYKCLK